MGDNRESRTGLNAFPTPRGPPAQDAGAGPGRVRFARVYQILIGALRWEPSLSTRGYTVPGSGP